MLDRTRSQLVAELDSVRQTQSALTERLRRMVTAMALSEEASADLNCRLDRSDDRPNGHSQAAATAGAAANTYRRFLTHLAEASDDAP